MKTALFLGGAIVFLALFSAPTRAASIYDLASGFETANQLYEEGKFSEAIAAYQQLLTGAQTSAPILFNLGNAYFKSGQVGRAIASYSQAERWAPRDSDIRANLSFARQRLGPEGALPDSGWNEKLSWLTLDELAAIASIGYWSCFGLLGLKALKPSTGPKLRGPIAVACVVGGIFTLWLGAALYSNVAVRRGVVVVSEAVVRRGPLDESQSAFSLHDGAEVLILDRKGDWREVTDARGQTGWLNQTQIAPLPGS